MIDNKIVEIQKTLDTKQLEYNQLLENLQLYDITLDNIKSRMTKSTSIKKKLKEVHHYYTLLNELKLQ